MPELTDMMNIGQEMAKKLNTVGIDSSEKLIEIGNFPMSVWCTCIL